MVEFPAGLFQKTRTIGKRISDAIRWKPQAPSAFTGTLYMLVKYRG
jgi:hypothetical protein